MRIRVAERLVEDNEVEITLYLGRGNAEPELAGAIRCDLDVWLLILAKLEAPYYLVERAPCESCGCRGHLGDVCLAALVNDDGMEYACRCGAPEPPPGTVLDEAEAAANVAFLDRARERAS